VDDLGAARREIAAAGLQVLDPGGDQLWVLDPDGNTVELTARRSD
jgi:catechol 2,3-dioxygenase-like lactoylglutathione lyase family enzyme